MYILTWKCASRHNGVQFFISHLASWLRTHRFSEPTFRPSGATNHGKNIVFRDFPTFSRICVFCPLTLSLLTLLTSAFQLSILSEVSLLNFLRIHARLVIPESLSLLPHITGLQSCYVSYVLNLLVANESTTAAVPFKFCGIIWSLFTSLFTRLDESLFVQFLEVPHVAHGYHGRCSHGHPGHPGHPGH